MEIDLLLNALLEKVRYQEYIQFLKSNEALRLYDKILGYVQIQIYPIGCLKWLEEDYLSYVYGVVLSKLKGSN